MSEQASGKEGDEKGQSANDEQNKNLVPKEEVERVTKEKDASIQVLQKTVEDLQSKLLDDSYLEFVTSKKSGTKEAVKSLEAAGVPQEVIAEITALKANSTQLQQTLANVVYHLELAECEKAHPDFNTYRADIQKILESPNGNYTFEQAYKLAKASKLEEAAPKGNKPESKEKPPASEKPSNRFPSGDGPKEYKTISEANTATIDALKSKYGLSGDTL